MAAAMQQFVDEFEQIPVVVLACLVRVPRRHRPRRRFGVPGVPEPAACRSRPRVRRRDDHVARHGRARAAGAARHPRRGARGGDHPARPARSAVMVPYAGGPCSELVYEDRWATSATWAVDPPGTRFTRAGPPRPIRRDHSTRVGNPLVETAGRFAEPGELMLQRDAAAGGQLGHERFHVGPSTGARSRRASGCTAGRTRSPCCPRRAARRRCAGRHRCTRRPRPQACAPRKQRSR